jgi:hypothetical protein
LRKGDRRSLSVTLWWGNGEHELTADDDEPGGDSTHLLNWAMRATGGAKEGKADG